MLYLEVDFTVNYFYNISFIGMICFAWNNANDNVSGMSRDRRDMEIAGTMGIMSILTGILYMVDFFYTMYQNALHGPANTY